MKVRLLTVAALAAVALGTQATAQQGDLERALADLNSGIVAPTMGAASASGSTGLDISGDARVRSNDFDGDILSGNFTHTRVRLNMNFSVNEASSAFIQWTGAEIWGLGSSGVNDPASLRNSGISQAYFTGRDLLGTGGDWKIGRSYETIGGGRILGTDDWDLTPVAWSGMSYANNFGGVDLGIQHLSANDTTVNFAGFPDDDGYWAISASFDLGNESITGIDFAHITGEMDEHVWWEASTGGSVSMFNWSYEMGDYDDGDTGNAGGSANAISVGLNMSDWTGGFVGALTYEMTDSDAGFRTIDAAGHGAAGLLDSFADGAWGGQADGFGGFYDLSTSQIHLDLNLMEGWSTRLSFISADLGDNPGMADLSVSETDLSIGTSLGGGVDAWFGYADASFEADGFTGSVDQSIYYVQLSLAF